MTNVNDKKKEYEKLKIIDNYLNQGWILYKKNDKYYFLKNKEIYKNKNINLKELFKNSE